MEQTRAGENEWKIWEVQLMRIDPGQVAARSGIPDATETWQMLEDVRQGDPKALDRLLANHRGYLHRVVTLRLDAGLQARVDASDVVQESQLEATRRIADYLQRRPMPFHLWLRQTACECLIALRRRHRDAQCRTVNQEVPLPNDSALLMGRQFLAADRTPSRRATEQEMIRRVRQTMAELAEEDREIILMRNFEELSNQDAAQCLDIEPATASKRYARALLRLRQRLADLGIRESQL